MLMKSSEKQMALAVLATLSVAILSLNHKVLKNISNGQKMELRNAQYKNNSSSVIDCDRVTEIVKALSSVGDSAKNQNELSENNKKHSDPLVLSDSSDYTWMGNLFVPPKGVPTFSPTEYLSYFSQRNTLFVGDSTGRRAYGTLFGIMTSSDSDNILPKELDSKKVIDFNKGRKFQERCMVKERSLYGSTDYVCRKVSDHVDIKTNENNSTIMHTFEQQEERNKTGKFDYLDRRCMGDLVDLFNANSTSIQNDYDLVVINLGVWEGVRSRDCSKNVLRRNETDGTNITVALSNEEKYDLVLDTLSSASSLNLQVVFRTPGFHQHHSGDEILWKLSRHAKDYSSKLLTSSFSGGAADVKSDKKQTTNDDAITMASTEGKMQQSNSNATNFTVLDWGTVISKRSFGGERIAGDIKPHYGLEARLLFAQQLLHHLLALEAKAKDSHEAALTTL